MNSNAGASDKAKIEVIRPGIKVGGVFEVSAYHPDGECFSHQVVPNSSTIEFVDVMLKTMFGAGTTTPLASGSGFAGLTYTAAAGTTGTTNYEYLVGIGTDSTVNLADTGSTYDLIATANEFVEVTNAQVSGTYARQPFVDMDFTTETQFENSGTARVVTNHNTEDNRATWTSATGFTVSACMLVFSNSTATGHATNASGNDVHNTLVACANITDVPLLADDIIKVKYSYTITAS